MLYQSHRMLPTACMRTNCAQYNRLGCYQLTASGMPVLYHGMNDHDATLRSDTVSIQNQCGISKYAVHAIPRPSATVVIRCMLPGCLLVLYEYQQRHRQSLDPAPAAAASWVLTYLKRPGVHLLQGLTCTNWVYGRSTLYQWY